MRVQSVGDRKAQRNGQCVEQRAAAKGTLVQIGDVNRRPHVGDVEGNDEYQEGPQGHRALPVFPNQDKGNEGNHCGNGENAQIHAP